MNRRPSAGPGWGRPVWATLLLAGACAQPFARVDGVLVDDRPATPDEYGRVEVTRDGTARAAAPWMILRHGDTVVTRADGTGMLTLAAGYQIIMDPGTDLTVENPSLFVRVGRVIIKKLRDVKESLTVNTEFGAAAVEGTVFAMEVDRGSQVRVSVLEGQVRFTSLDGAYEPVVYTGGQWGAIGRRPMDRGTLSTAQTNALRRRITTVEQAVRPTVPEVIGLREAAARAALERLGFRVGVNRVITRDAPAGTVVGVFPQAGTARRIGETIQLRVEDNSVAVPPVVGRTYAAAVRELTARGLSVKDTTSVVDADAQPGTIVKADPPPGRFVRPGERISLTIARAPILRGEITTVRMCTVPPLSRLNEAAARRALTDAGLGVGQITRGAGDLVTAQSHAAQASIVCGTAVAFTLGTVIR